MKDIPVLWIIVPCFNEQEVLPITAPVFLEKINELSEKNKISSESRILFINDGSSDKTWEIICGLAQKDRHFIGISQSRNRGHQSSLIAGLMEAKDKCDITISIDCDGQDDINVMETMIDKFSQEDCEIVYGIRSNRDSDSYFKKTTAQGFYKFMNVMGAEVVYNHADYRLVSSRVLNALADFKEVNIFLRGMFPLVGFKSTCVPYVRHERLAGKTHYPFAKMLGLAIDGITSLSTRPIAIIAVIGIIISLLGFAGILWAIIVSFMGQSIPGWASTICIVCFLGGIQLLSLGVIGEYVGKSYMEAKHRPVYIISEKTY